MSTPTPPTQTACEALQALDDEISRAFADAAISCGCEDIDDDEHYEEEAHEADCHVRVLNRTASDGVPIIREALADAAALREHAAREAKRINNAIAMLNKQQGEARIIALEWLQQSANRLDLAARAFLAPTEPDGASEAKEKQMSEPKTLEEELLRAAERADFAALQCTPQAVGVRWSYLRGIHEAEAARLRQRAAWVRQAQDNIAEMGISGPGTAGAAEMFRSLTGPDLFPGAATPSPETGTAAVPGAHVKGMYCPACDREHPDVAVPAPEPVKPPATCGRCEIGFPINEDGEHYGTQRLGMIPNAPCSRVAHPSSGDSADDRAVPYVRLLVRSRLQGLRRMWEASMSPGTPRVALRKMTGVERKRAHALASSLLFGGEHKDSIVGTIRGYLTARGWGRAAADERAHEVYFAALGASR